MQEKKNWTKKIEDKIIQVVGKKYFESNFVL
jgi:hypothetical protein